MIAHFSIQGDDKKYSFPLDLSSVTLRQYIDYCNFEKECLPSEFSELRQLYNDLADIPVTDKLDRKPVESRIRELEDTINSFEYVETRITWYAQVVNFWTGLSVDKIMGEVDGVGMDISQLTTLYNRLQQLCLTPDKTEYTNIIEHNGEAWYLPSQYMKDSTVIEYLESSQFYKLADDLAGHQWGVMGKVMCILVRKENEKYSRKLMKREEFFLSWTMDKVYQVAFFLTIRMQKLATVFQTYTHAQALSKLRQELKS